MHWHINELICHYHSSNFIYMPLAHNSCAQKEFYIWDLRKVVCAQKEF